VGDQKGRQVIGEKAAWCLLEPAVCLEEGPDGSAVRSSRIFTQPRPHAASDDGLFDSIGQQAGHKGLRDYLSDFSEFLTPCQEMCCIARGKSMPRFFLTAWGCGDKFGVTNI
jgi:hypothetical protein